MVKANIYLEHNVSESLSARDKTTDNASYSLVDISICAWVDIGRSKV